MEHKVSGISVKWCKTDFYCSVYAWCARSDWCSAAAKAKRRFYIDQLQSKTTSERSRNSTWTHNCKDFIKTNLKIHKKRTKVIVFYLTALVILMNKHFNPTNIQKHVCVNNQTSVQQPFSDTGITWLWLLTWLLLMFWPQKCWYSSAWSMLGAVTGLKQEIHIWQRQRRGGDENCCACISAKTTLRQFLIWQIPQK